MIIESSGLPAQAQSVDWAVVAPAVATAATAGAVLLADLVLGPTRRAVLGWISAAGLVVSFALLLPLVGSARSTFCLPGGPATYPSCSYRVDALTVAFQLLTVLASLVVVLLSVGVLRDERLPAGEYWFLLLCSVTGALVLAAARDLLTLVVALEVVTLPTYALVGLRRDDPRSSEAALKYFLVSVVSSALMLYGVALLYGTTGQVLLDRVATALSVPGQPSVARAGVVLTVAGFAFKVAAVPFHVWAPDTYVGAPVPVAAYLSVVSKAAGFAGLLLVLAVAFPAYAGTWSPVVAVVAALTMTVGNVVALRQRHAVRLLAWSSVAQTGYMLVPLGSAGHDLSAAVQATVAYVLAFGVMDLLAFGVVVLVGRHRPGGALADYRGLWRTEPLTAVALAFALACLAGLPPGLLGLWAKLTILQVPVAAGQGWLAVVVAVNIVVGLAYYLRWAGLLVARPLPGSRPPSYRLLVPEGLALGVSLGAAVAFSVVPGPLLEALTSGAPFLH
ncbi:MAG: NADH-quinone oxidoreductase subunit N [Motilibacteraceae bacterium]